MEADREALEYRLTCAKIMKSQLVGLLQTGDYLPEVRRLMGLAIKEKQVVITRTARALASKGCRQSQLP
ncbi:hypothetical protein J4G48_0040070 [Bradyrhizobium barranii subsp. apii]|uniref:hypothetical protein n=1 Tax=Bradyrhizobium barranii TaxID=2992140 RepID=UPI001AA18A27|nr:hypothetical protein [Bradyrhizobium barranii]UPT95356.1 hypothetical protein J4G48_0040070 [Bradyrhizobium barranii subsp. apii]